ncbi:MAG: glutamate formimidoyltransferase [Planctomycetes bacterium]|nr:glutamate formimidoyltransferase [Planctomycetota bacterium]
MSIERIVECVPNFSEGRERSIIDAIAKALDSVAGARVLDVDPGAATNRTVMTLVGAPEAVLEAAFQGIRVAQQLIDMRQHKGEHARIGATDVCPFIPVSGVSMEECAELARRLGKRVGNELGISVYLYEAAAATAQRRNLADVRAGEYEGLAAKLADPAWKPDYGPAQFNAQSGASVIGARPFLIAFNVNLNTRAKKLASDVANAIREQGTPQRGADGKLLKDAQGRTLTTPGRLKSVKAVGWIIEEYARAQVSVNVCDFNTTGVEAVFDAAEEEARALGARVTGSELVGLVPLAALLQAGRHYLKRQGQCSGQSDGRLIEVAVQSLGLAELKPFVPTQSIIEYRLRAETKTLAGLSLEAFADELASASPAPGGGSVAALVASLAAALCSMVANLTVGKKGYEQHDQDNNRIAETSQSLKGVFLRAIDEDTAAFDAYMAAMRLPKTSPVEAATRAAAMDVATRGAVAVPMSVLERIPSVLAIASEVLQKGNRNAASDAATAAACALAAAEGALYNVLTNIHELDQSVAWVAQARAQAARAMASIRPAAASVQSSFLSRMEA